MPHHALRDPRHRGQEAEHLTVITGGGPNRPRILLSATAAWVAPGGGGGGWGSGLVPACLRVHSVRILPMTAAEAVSEATRGLLEARMRSNRRTISGRIVVETGSDPASVRLAQTCGGTATEGVVGRAYALVNGGRDPAQHARDSAGAEMVGAQWLVSRVDALLPHAPLGDEDAERGWPYLFGRIVVDLKQIDAEGEGALPASDIQRALASTERLIRPGSMADEALLVTDPVEAVSTALMLGMIDVDRFGCASAWSTPLPPGPRMWS